MTRKKKPLKITREQLPRILKNALRATAQVLKSEADNFAAASKDRADALVDTTIDAAERALKMGLEQIEWLKKGREDIKKPGSK